MSASNSAWLIAPLSSSDFACAIWSAGELPATDLMYVVLLRLDLLHLRLAAVGHAIVLRDQVDEDAEVRQEDDEDDPDRLHPAADVAPRKTSANTVISSQIQMMNTKKMTIDQRTSRNG